MIAVFCGSPFQLVCALSLVYREFKEECVLFITEDMFKSELKFRISNIENEYVKGVKYVKMYPEKNADFALNMIKRVFGNWNKEKIKYYIPDFDFSIHFDKAICIAASSLALVLNKYYSGQLDLYQIDEGIGDYFVCTKQILELEKYVKCRYLLAPELYMRNDGIENRRMPYAYGDKELQDTIKTVFGGVDVSMFKRVVYFAQPYENDYQIQGFDDVENQVIDALCQQFGKENVLIKRHPRENKKGNYELEELKTTTPWEAYVNELEDIDNMLLVSINSTALITPKLLFNREPAILILENIFRPVWTEAMCESDNMIKFFENIRKTYNNPEKFIIPDNVDELKRELSLLKL